jgi:alpha-N-arabinofuranosidase
MKHPGFSVITWALVSASALVTLPVDASAQDATIKIDVLRKVGEIDPNIYGVFMEPIRSSMDGLLYDPDHPLANEDGFRTDYIEAARELQLTNMRWPGGNYTASYDWKDGIGPKNQRPVRRELAWNVLDRNHVGTDEWIALSRAMGVDNSICINGGTGTVDDAREWIEYVNSPTGSYWADLRAEYGHPEPFDVTSWHLGNEVDGKPWQAVYSTPEEYVRFAENAANIMYFVNRGCESCAQPVFLVMGSSWISSNGVPGEWERWNWKVIDGLITKRNVEYIAIHRYWGRDLNEEIQRDDSPAVYLGDWAMHFDDYITTTWNQIQIAKVMHDVRDKPFHIAFTEWSPGNRSHLSTLAGALHFNLFVRHADAVKRANYTMFISLLARNQDGETYRSPFFYMFKLFSTNVRGTSLDVHVESDTFDGRVYQDMPYLDVSASYAEDDGTVVINVVNRNMDDAITTDIISDTGEFVGDAAVSVIQRDDINGPYTFEERDQYAPATSTVRAAGSSFRYRFAPHSFTQIRVRLE